MRVMYVASKGLFETDLDLTREVTDLQRSLRATGASALISKLFRR